VGVERALREYEDKKIIKPLEPASIMVRLVDQQRGATASHPFPPNSDGENLKIPSEYTDMMVRLGSLGLIKVWGVVHRVSSRHHPLILSHSKPCSKA
jgi:hypothetical protein